ncbi:MAG: glycosyltransferase family 2 protein [Actinobacteria bacterium]|nr:glycosyltransferase family 2 protein [Actinomycetota bacterium]
MIGNAMETRTGPDIDLSIVIVSYNTCDLLLDCLAALYHGPHDYSFEVIVCDNASSDGSENAVRQSFPQTIVIQTGENIGFGSAMNIGSSKASGKYLLVLNPDTIVHPKSLRRLLDLLESSPREMVISCRLKSPEGTYQLSCARFPTPLRIFLLFTRLNKFMPAGQMQLYYSRPDLSQPSTLEEDQRIRQVETVLGAFFILPLDTFVNAGGFDERFFMHYEEIDLFKRLYNMGHFTYFLPTESVIHYGGQSTKSDYEKMRLEQQRSLLLYIHKWHGIHAARLIRIFLISLALVRFVAAKTILRGEKGDRQSHQFENSSRVILSGLIHFHLNARSLQR